jgi:hypothetical protein
VVLLVVISHLVSGSQILFLYAIRVYDAMTTSGPIRPHQKKRLPNIVDIHVVGDKTHSSLWLALSDMTYSNE